MIIQMYVAIARKSASYNQQTIALVAIATNNTASCI